MTWPRGNSFHTCGEKMPKCVRASAAVSGPECAGENVQDARAELAVLVLLAPDARRQIHQRRERAVRAAERPHAGELVGIDRRVLADEADRGRDVARFLNRGLEPRAARVRLRIVVAPEAAVLEVDRLRQIRGDRQHAVVRDVVQPLDDLGDRRGARPPTSPALRNSAIFTCFLRAASRIRDRERLRLLRQIGDAQPIVEERIVLHVDAEREARPSPCRRSRRGDRPASRPRPLRSSTDIATSMFVLNWISRSFVSVTAPLSHALELHAVALPRTSARARRSSPSSS